MKNLILVFAILMLGCTTYPDVVEEPSLVAAEPPPIAEEPAPAVKVLTPIAEEPPPTMEANRKGPVRVRIIKSNIFAEREGEDFDHVRFDPVLLNRQGIFYEFDRDLSRFKAIVSLDGESLEWTPLDELTDAEIGSSITLKPGVQSTLLQYDKEYVAKILYEDNLGDKAITRTILRTIPRP